MNLNHWSSVIPDRKARCKLIKTNAKKNEQEERGWVPIISYPGGMEIHGNPFSIHMPSISIRVLTHSRWDPEPGQAGTDRDPVERKGGS